MRRGDWMQTYTGRQFWPMDPRADEIEIKDIAHALSMQCRFAGHCHAFYSVAQHSVLVSLEAQRLAFARFNEEFRFAQIGAEAAGEELRRIALAGLLHDASEAYLVDVPRPVKPHLVGYDVAEAAVMGVILHRFYLSAILPPEVKEADGVLLATEARDLMAPPPVPWAPMPAPLPLRIFPLEPVAARGLFLARFAALTGGRP